MSLLLIRQEDNYKIGIWKIEEDYTFFHERIQLQPSGKHPQRHLQQLATRYLLKEVEADFRLEDMQQQEGGKPMLHGNQPKFNLSHTSQLAAVIISHTHEVGIDAEKINERVSKVKHKFLNQVEVNFIEQLGEEAQVSMLTRFWTIKEAVYKWWGKGNVDFARDINIIPPGEDQEKLLVQLKKDSVNELTVFSFLLDDHWISYLVN